MSTRRGEDEREGSIGRLFIRRTSYRRGEEEGRRSRGTRPPLYLEHPRRGGVAALPVVGPEGGAPLWDVVARRRSLRRYLSRPIALDELSRLLWATQGITGRSAERELRAAPSAGAEYPLETYLVVNRVDGLPAGLYHYRVKEADLELLGEGGFGPALARACVGQQMMADAAVCFVWTAVFSRSTWRYAERAFRYFYLDAGHLGAQLHLAATALDLGCCAVGAYYDEEVDGLLGVDGETETTVYLSSVGPI